MVPELDRDGSPWNASELAMRPEVLREDCRIRLSSWISDLQPMAARTIPSQKYT